jgi:hypothetical protein
MTEESFNSRSWFFAVLGIVGALVVVVAVVSAAGRARTEPPLCSPAQLRLSISVPGIGFTGGAYAVEVVLRNVSRSVCEVEGHPLVVVTPHPFPVVVGDLADFYRYDPNIGPERVVGIGPAMRVHAEAVIRRRCDGAKREMTRTAIEFSFDERSTSLTVSACRQQGVEIDTGPFLPPG